MPKKTTAAPKEDPKPTPAPTEAPTEAPQGKAVSVALELAPTPAPAAASIPDLDVFIATHEKTAQDTGLVVTAIAHPDARPRMHLGTYSGFPITDGPLQATYSDGSTH